MLKVYYFVYVSIAYMCVVYYRHAVPLQAKEGVKSPGTGVIDGCEPPHGWLELGPGLLQEQKVL